MKRVLTLKILNPVIEIIEFQCNVNSIISKTENNEDV